MLLANETRQRKKALGLTFFEFYEAIARIADRLRPPLIQPPTTAMAKPLTATGLSTEAEAASRIKLAADRDELHPLEAYITDRRGPNAVSGAAGAGAGTAGGPAANTAANGPGSETAKARILHVRVQSLLSYAGYRMRAVWGGSDVNDCVVAMNKASSKFESGIA